MADDLAAAIACEGVDDAADPVAILAAQARSRDLRAALRKALKNQETMGAKVKKTDDLTEQILLPICPFFPHE